MSNQKIDKTNFIFDNRALVSLLFPVVVEQLLNSLMGMIDTMMVGNVSSVALSAVSLVDSINLLIIQVFAALAAGGTILCSQYLGDKNEEGCNRAARQVVLVVFFISVALTVLGLVFRTPLLHLVFGQVEADVMENSMDYFGITVLSYPFFALFCAGSAFFRAEGNAKFPMEVSILSNLMNIAGNALLIFGLGMGVKGAALSTLFSRIFCTVVVFYRLRSPKQTIVIRNYHSIRPDRKLIGKILSVAVPAGVENAMFQFGKLAIQSTVSTMGTAAIAAQAMTNILESMNGIFGMGVGIGLMTIVGQCIGADEPEQARYYIKKLTCIAEIGVLLSCLLIYAIARPVARLGGLSGESASLCIQMVTAITIVKPLVWTLSFVPPYGMRAAGDVRFSMVVSLLSMWCLRVALCVFLVRVFGMGPMAVWIGMFADWTLRAILFTWRFHSGKWLKKKLV